MVLRKVVGKVQKEISELKPTFDLIFRVTDIFSLPETLQKCWIPYRWALELQGKLLLEPPMS